MVRPRDDGACAGVGIRASVERRVDVGDERADARALRCPVGTCGAPGVGMNTNDGLLRRRWIDRDRSRRKDGEREEDEEVAHSSGR